MQEGFYAWDSLPVQPKKEIRKAFYATVSILHAPWGAVQSRGSGVVVSEDGYVVTSLHVIDGAQEFRSLLEVVDADPENGPGGEALLRWKTLAPKGVFLKSILIPELGAWNGVELVAMGKVRASGLNREKLKQKAQYGTIESEDLLEDFAVLKVRTLPGQKLTCLPVAKSKAKKGDDVWRVGLPTEAPREDAPGNNGFSKYATFGKVRTYPYEELPWLAKLASRRDPNFIDDADAIFGMSGGAVVNENVELVGITRAIENADAKKRSNPRIDNLGASKDTYSFEFPDGSHSVDARTVYELLKERMGKDRTRAAFRCPRGTDLPEHPPLPAHYKNGDPTLYSNNVAQQLGRDVLDFPTRLPNTPWVNQDPSAQLTMSVFVSGNLAVKESEKGDQPAPSIECSMPDASAISSCVPGNNGNSAVKEIRINAQALQIRINRNLQITLHNELRSNLRKWVKEFNLHLNEVAPENRESYFRSLLTLTFVNAGEKAFHSAIEKNLFPEAPELYIPYEARTRILRKMSDEWALAFYRSVPAALLERHTGIRAEIAPTLAAQGHSCEECL